MTDEVGATALLTVAEMARADLAAVAAGVPSLTLMENAGGLVATEVERLLPVDGCVVVFCGPGNNGGDGYVAARVLASRGVAVAVGVLADSTRLAGDAAEMARRWTAVGQVSNWRTLLPRSKAEAKRLVIVDAVLGAGLSRPPSGEYAEVIAAMNAARGKGAAVLAVDVPSGLDGTSGTAPGDVVEADLTVTFFRKKPGHLLLPGRELCGPVVVGDIGIAQAVLKAIAPAQSVNRPQHLLQVIAAPRPATHKYGRGHVIVVSGPPHATGAARLAARAALRAGAGLVTVASPLEAVSTNAAHLTAIMIAPFDGAAGLLSVLADKRISSVVIGPACGVGAQTREMVAAVLATRAQVVLDADALTSFAGQPDALFAQTSGRGGVVMTPHEGEFARLFGALAGSKLERARQAARKSGAVVILKGADTVVAEPAGEAVINDNAPPWLATAGSGDVLAGLTAGLMAQSLSAFDAARAAVWLHGACGGICGPGLIAEDLSEAVPRILAGLTHCR